MYILKNAWISIQRNKGRNILMGIVILVIACFATVTLAIRSSAEKLTASVTSQYEIGASIQMNRENMRESFRPGQGMEEAIEKFENIPSITEEEIIRYGDSSHVRSFYYTNTISIDSNLEKATTENGGKGFDKRTAEGDFSLVGYSSLSAMNEFIEGKYTIIEGSVSEDMTGDTCVINTELASFNDLSVGDMITLIDPFDDTVTYSLTITGIYEEKEEQSFDLFTGSANTILTNTTVVSNILAKDSQFQSQVSPTFLLYGKDDIEAFSQEVTDKGLDDSYQITTNLAEIESETQAIQNLSSFATTFLVVTMIIGAIVLLVLTMINIRERKYEIGVLRTIGMKKKTVTIQFGFELLIVTFVFLIVGLGIGTLISVPTANSLLKQQVENSQNTQKDIQDRFGKGETAPNLPDGIPGGNSGLEPIDEIQAIVDFEVVLKLFGVGMVLTLLSTLCAMIHISRVEPIQILKERT